MFQDAFAIVIGQLDTLGIDHAVSGSFALAHWGVVRATTDADLKVRAVVDDPRLEDLHRALRPRGFRYLDATSYSYRGIEIELYPVEDRIDEESLERRVRAEMFGQPCWIVTAEDLILSKLREYSRAKDYKHVDDIRKLLVAHPSVDVTYLAQRLTAYGFSGLWQEQVLPDSTEFSV